jgi:hypothetical protein
MKRNAFLGTAAGAAVTIGALSAVPAQAKDQASDRNLSFMAKIVGTVVDDLYGDSNDYGGYKKKAIENLKAAVSNLNAAVSYDQTHNG